jgi:type I restriction enzyme S subunit
MGQSPKSEECNTDGIGFPFLQGNAEFGEFHPTVKYYCENVNKICNKESILLSVRAPVGALNIADKNYGIGRGLCAISPFNNYDLRFLWYSIQLLREQLNLYSTGSTFEAVSVDEVENILSIVPSLPEQQSIAKFLDYKTEQIDTLIEKKEHLLKLLEEKRIALITNAVTGKLHCHSERSEESLSNSIVNMKDSGIPWLGNIPLHWEAKRLKFSVKLINDKVDTEEVELPYMGLENIDSWNGNKIETTEYSPEGIANAFRNGDVLFGKLRPYLAKVFLAQEEGCCTTEAIVLRSKEVVLPIFLQYYLLSEMFIEIVNSSTFGSKMPRASWEFIGSLALLLPPLPEQKLIVEYLNKELRKIDQLSEKVTTAIEKLKEYRTSLITSAVTGKIDLRNWRPSLPLPLGEGWGEGSGEN